MLSPNTTLHFSGSEHLTPRELQVASRLTVECDSTKEAARALGISPRTVEVYRHRIFEKCGVRNIVGLSRLVYGAKPTRQAA